MVLNRTLGYNGEEVPRVPQTPHGYKKTEITDYKREKWVDLFEGIEIPRIDTAQKLERQRRLKIMKALQGPPHMGKSLIPQLPVPYDMALELIENAPLKDRVSTPHTSICTWLLSNVEQLLSSANLSALCVCVCVCLLRALSLSTLSCYSFRCRSWMPDRLKSENASKTDLFSNLRARKSTNMSPSLL